MSMITGKEDLLKALSEIFLMEKGTKIFYERAAEKAVNEDARNTFKELSEWEDEHMDYALALYRTVQEDWDMMSYEEFKSKADTDVTEAGIPIRDLEAKTDDYCITDEMGALTLALELEGKAYNMYRKYSENSEDTNARIIFREMMEQEVRHINHLKELRNRLADVYK